MLASIFASLGGQLLTGFFDNALKAYQAYVNKEITREQLDAQLRQHFFDMVGQIETAYAKSISETYGTFMGVVKESRMVRIVWATVTISQLVVLLWHQIGIPALVYFTETRYPSSGSTVDWAYLLLAGCVGFGAVTLRGGQAGSTTSDTFKSMLKRQ